MPSAYCLSSNTDDSPKKQIGFWTKDFIVWSLQHNTLKRNSGDVRTLGNTLGNMEGGHCRQHVYAFQTLFPSLSYGSFNSWLGNFYLALACILMYPCLYFREWNVPWRCTLENGKKHLVVKLLPLTFVCGGYISLLQLSEIQFFFSWCLWSYTSQPLPQGDAVTLHITSHRVVVSALTCVRAYLVY